MDYAAKVKKLREAAKDKSLPQDVRNQMLDNANALEEKAAKGAGVALAKGGMAKKKSGEMDKKTTSRNPVVAVMIGMTDKKGVAAKKPAMAKKMKKGC